jgi:hypothetical protein
MIEQDHLVDRKPTVLAMFGMLYICICHSQAGEELTATSTSLLILTHVYNSSVQGIYENPIGASIRPTNNYSDHGKAGRCYCGIQDGRHGEFSRMPATRISRKSSHLILYSISRRWVKQFLISTD